jgi:hypothetical protein
MNSISMPLDTLSSRCFTFIRENVFHTNLFIMGKAFYSKSDMDKFDESFQKQLLSNYSEFRYLSRYILEDIIKCKARDHFLLCLPTNAGDALGVDLHHTAHAQRRLNNGGEQCSIAGKSYYCFHVTIDLSTNHQEIAQGMNQSQFSTMFHNKSGGFRIVFDDIPGQNLFIKWYDIVNCPHVVMLFGQPLLSNRPMDHLFANDRNDSWAHHIFRHFALQYYGDSKQSAILYASYLNCLRRNALEREAAALDPEANIFGKTTLLTQEVRVFCKVFNKYCRYAFILSLRTFQNNTGSPVLDEDWFNFVHMAKRIMNKQWRVLATYRNTTSANHPDRIVCVEHQIFCQLMTMLHFANFSLLGRWALMFIRQKQKSRVLFV